MFLGPDDIQLGHGEPLKDTARVLGRYVDGVMARLFDHADVEVLAEYADCPVINGLTDEAHPCQTLADLLTIRETVGEDAAVAWVGDGNNVGQSFVVGAAMAGVDVEVATPAGYGMDPDVFERAAEFGADVAPTTDPATAIEGADVVYTDVWISMGQEDERDEKLAAFDGFQVNADLLADTGCTRRTRCWSNCSAGSETKTAVGWAPIATERSVAARSRTPETRHGRSPGERDERRTHDHDERGGNQRPGDSLEVVR